MKKQTITLLVLILLIGCKSINETRKSAGISKQSLYINESTKKDKTEPSIVFQPTLFWSHYDASQRAGLYLVTPQSDGTMKINIISENPPDAALNSTIETLAKVKVGDKVDAGAKFSTIKSVTELGQRNAANYMIRDFAFRIEALQNNGGKIDDKILELYKTLIKTAENISIAEVNSNNNKNKLETIQELSKMINFTKDSAYNKLKLDSTFFQNIQNYLDK